MKQATVWSVFFSLRGSLPRDQWRLAMAAAGSVFVFVLSLLMGDSEPGYARAGPAGPSWLVVAWSLAALGVVTLLCAKRLIDCERPVWLALTVAGPGLLVILALAAGGAHALRTAWTCSWRSAPRSARPASLSHARRRRAGAERAGCSYPQNCLDL